MDRLSTKVIRILAARFRGIGAMCEDRKALVDQLGFHPVNHARFMEELVCCGKPEDRAEYYRLTEWLATLPQVADRVATE